MPSNPSPKDWLILQCAACGSPMKVRPAAMAGNRLSCPVCRSPVAIAGREEAAPEFRAEVPVVTPGAAPPPTRRRPIDESEQSPEFAPSAGRPTPEDAAGFLGNLRHTDEHQSGRQVRVKKRRKKGGVSLRDHLTDWNSAPESLPEAEVLSDPWIAPMPIPEEVIREKERDFVVSEHFEDGQSVRRVKRVRKRRVFTLAQLFFRRLSYGMRVLTLTLVAAIFVVGVGYGIIVFRQRFAPVTFDDVVAEQQPSRDILSMQSENSAAEAIKGFLAAKGVEEKLRWVRLPKRVRPMMEVWYRDHEDVPLKAGEVINRQKFSENNAFFIHLEVKVAPLNGDPAKPGTESRFFIVEESGNGGDLKYKVDWENSVDWQEMSFAEFRLQQPRRPVTFRVKLRESNYYHHGFADQKKWFAAEVFYPFPDRTEFLFYAYIQRGSREWNDLKLFTEAGVGAHPAVTVRLRYPDDALSRDQVIVDSVISPTSWIAMKDVPPEEFADTGANPAPPSTPR